MNANAVVQRQLRKQLIQERLKAHANRELPKNTVSLINKAKYLLILFIFVKVVWGILHQFQQRVKQSNENTGDVPTDL